MRLRYFSIFITLCALFALSVGAGSAHLLFGKTQSNMAQAQPTLEPAYSAQSLYVQATPTNTPTQTPIEESTPAPTQKTAPIAIPSTAPGDTVAATLTATPVPIYTETPIPTATKPPIAAVTHTPTPWPTPVAERTGGPVAVPNKHKGPRWVTLQAGHYQNHALPEELKHLIGYTGGWVPGVNEVDINMAVAKLTAQRLFERGYSVEVLGATVPPNYVTDLFLALHADGNVKKSLRGFKAVAPWGFVPASDIFVGYLYEEYGKATGLPSDPKTSDTMANYYAFNPIKYHHTVNQQVPSAILEMGFLTNASDREVLVRYQERLALGIANAVDRYFRSGAAGPTPSTYPSFTPSRTATPTVTVEVTTTETLGTPQPIDATILTRTANEATQSPTPMTGIITADGRWLPPVAPNGRKLPPLGSDEPPVLLSQANDDIGPEYTAKVPGWQPHVWREYYVPRLGRTIWQMGPVFEKTPTPTITLTTTPTSTTATATATPTSTLTTEPQR